MIEGITIIIPVAIGDHSYKELLNDLSFIEPIDQIIIVSPEMKPIDLINNHKNFNWVNSEIGRAKQLNTGANVAKNNILWFLHGDSRIELQAYKKLKECINLNSNCLYYFDLKFSKDGPRFMILNELGVFFRSRVLKIPFGDQGFCMRKDIFFKLGGFDEECLYGEDHLFIWIAHLNNIQVRSVKHSITTSARKYRVKGWGKVTINHLVKTFQQGFPEFVKLLKQKIR